MWAKEGNTNYGVCSVLSDPKACPLFLNSRPLHIPLPWPEMFFPSGLAQLAPSHPCFTFSERPYLIILTKGAFPGLGQSLS